VAVSGISALRGILLKLGPS